MGEYQCPYCCILFFALSQSWKTASDFNVRGARKWAPISVILAKPSNMAILVSTPIGPRSESNTPHEIAYVQIGAGFLFGAPKLQSPCSRLMPQKGWGPDLGKVEQFFRTFWDRQDIFTPIHFQVYEFSNLLVSSGWKHVKKELEQLPKLFLNCESDLVRCKGQLWVMEWNFLGWDNRIPVGMLQAWKPWSH